jgi:16S rRNA processing protein RimM
LKSCRPVVAAPGEWLRLGVLAGPWGTRGEIKVVLDAEPHLLERLTVVYVGADRRCEALLGIFRRGRGHTLRLNGVDTMSDAEKLRGCEVAILRADAPPLPAGSYYVDQIVGLTAVTTDGRDLGTVVDVLSTGANDVYVVRNGASEVLIPAVRDVVVELDPSEGILRVEPVPGLLHE